METKKDNVANQSENIVNNTQDLRELITNFRSDFSSSLDENESDQQLIARIQTLYSFIDKKSGFHTNKIVIRKIKPEELKIRSNDWNFFDISKGIGVEIHVIDKNGTEVGIFDRSIILTTKNDIYVEHNYANFSKTGTGFGSRYQAHVEHGYKKIGIKAIMRGCGLYIGRYEGAKNGFDFMDEDMRRKFIQGFCDFLIENGVRVVTFQKHSFPVDQIPNHLHKAQDILHVKADKSVCSLKYERKNRDSNPPYKWLSVKPKYNVFLPSLAGKAFYLDEGSNAKKKMEPHTDHEQFSIGKWAGIKKL